MMKYFAALACVLTAVAVGGLLISPSQSIDQQAVSTQTANVVELTENNFAEFKAETEVLLVVKCWAPSCAPSTLFDADLESLSAEFSGKALIGKLNVDDCARIGQGLRVERIPTYLFVKNGMIQERVVATIEYKELKQLMEKHSS